MGKLKALDENLNLTNKRIILRVDLNVPMKEGKVTDKSRINKIIPIIKEFTYKKAKVILVSHLGRPGGKIDEKLSLKPIAPILESLLNSKIFKNVNVLDLQEEFSFYELLKSTGVFTKTWGNKKF